MPTSRFRRPSEDFYDGDYRVEFRDTGNIDAFGRLRVSLPQTQWGYTNQYGTSSLMVEQWATGTGTSTHDANSSSVVMSTGGTASGAKVTRQTRQYFRYVPGKSMMILQSGVFGPAAANVRRRRGLFDDRNGVFVEQTSSGVFVVIRSYVSGAVLENRVAQADWNMDIMDGTGESGITLDMSKSNIILIDLEWLGAGRVRFGFVIDGHFYYVHEFKNANNLANAYMTTANLPLRAELENTGTADATATMRLICATVLIEGDGDSGGQYTHGVSNGIAATAVTTRRAVLSIRPKATFNSITNRGIIIPENFSLSAGSNSAYWEIVYGGTIGGSPSWGSAGANSIVEFDTAGTTVTGGEVVACGFVSTSSGVSKEQISMDISSRYPIALDHDGLNPVPLSIVCTSFTGTSNISAALNFKEYF